MRITQPLEHTVELNDFEVPLSELLLLQEKHRTPPDELACFAKFSESEVVVEEKFEILIVISYFLVKTEHYIEHP